MVDFGSGFSELEVWVEGLGHFGLLLSASGARVAISLIKVSFFERWSCQPQARTSRPNLYPQGGEGPHVTKFRSWILLPSCKRLYATKALKWDPKMVPFWCFWKGPCESGIYAPARTGTLLTTFSVIWELSKNDIQKTLAKKQTIQQNILKIASTCGPGCLIMLTFSVPKACRNWRNDLWRVPKRSKRASRFKNSI